MGSHRSAQMALWKSPFSFCISVLGEVDVRALPGEKSRVTAARGLLEHKDRSACTAGAGLEQQHGQGPAVLLQGCVGWCQGGGVSFGCWHVQGRLLALCDLLRLCPSPIPSQGTSCHHVYLYPPFPILLYSHGVLFWELEEIYPHPRQAVTAIRIIWEIMYPGKCVPSGEEQPASRWEGLVRELGFPFKEKQGPRREKISKCVQWSVRLLHRESKVQTQTCAFSPFPVPQTSPVSLKLLGISFKPSKRVRLTFL